MHPTAPVPPAPPESGLSPAHAARIGVMRRFVDEEADGVQRRAAELIKVDPSLITRILAGDRDVTRDVAEAMELASQGRFPRVSVLWPLEFPLPPPREPRA